MSFLINKITLCAVLTATTAAFTCAHDGMMHDSDVGQKGGSTVKYSTPHLESGAGSYATRDAHQPFVGPKGGDTRKYQMSNPDEAGTMMNMPQSFRATAHADKDVGPKGGSARKY